MSQKALIEKDGRVLVTFSPSGIIDFPGGRIDEGETDLIAALEREVREETTLEIEVGRPFATWLTQEATVYFVAYRCRYISGEVELSGEHGHYRWVERANFQEVADGSLQFAVLQQYFDA